MNKAVEIRPATHDDHDDVVSFTSDTWDDGDYLPAVYHDWIEGGGKRTLVADVDDRVVGIAQIVRLSASEAWAQGLRIDPEYRGEGISRRLTHDMFDWAADQGAVVARNMVFSWNAAGLGQSRATGYEPVTEFRWLRPDPEPGGPAVANDPGAAYSYWRRSDAAAALAGLGLSLDESWALQEVSHDLLCRAAEETRVLTVGSPRGTRAVSYRTRTFDREGEDGDTALWAEYGVAAWADLPAAETLLDAIRADAAALGADRTRVLVPETAAFVSDGAYLRANVAEEPDFVLAADLTGEYRSPPPAVRSKSTQGP